jgi:N-acetylmuramoyl-L-alanine amidase
MRKSHYLIPFLFLLVAAPSWAKPRIVLDAAHGGNDPGVRKGSAVEKEWNYRFAQAFSKAFEDAGFEVILIRKRDETIGADKRSEMINVTQASAAIIIHVDAEWTGTQKGPLVVVEPPTRGEENGEIQRWGAVSPALHHSSLRLARDIAEKLGIGTELSSLSDARGLAGETPTAAGRVFCLPHQSLRYLTLPSVVVTPMFLTSASDVKKFSKSESLADFATKVARGAAGYFRIAP